MTSTMEVEQKLDSSTKLEQQVKTLRWVVVMLAIVVVALGVWIVFDFSQEAALSPNAEISQLVEDYTAAWNEYDGDAFLATTREGYVFTSNISGVFDRDAQFEVIRADLPATAWSVKMLEDPTVVGLGPWYYVSFPVETETILQGERQGMTILTVYEADDGNFYVIDHLYAGR